MRASGDLRHIFGLRLAPDSENTQDTNGRGTRYEILQGLPPPCVVKGLGQRRIATQPPGPVRVLDLTKDRGRQRCLRRSPKTEARVVSRVCSRGLPSAYSASRQRPPTYRSYARILGLESAPSHDGPYEQTPLMTSQQSRYGVRRSSSGSLFASISHRRQKRQEATTTHRRRDKSSDTKDGINHRSLPRPEKLAVPAVFGRFHSGSSSPLASRSSQVVREVYLPTPLRTRRPRTEEEPNM